MLQEARSQVAWLIGAHDTDVLFTSGGTESNNLAITCGISGDQDRNEIVLSEVEHPSVHAKCEALASSHIVKFVRTTSDGVIDIEHLKSLVGPQTALVSIMMANNETGVIMPVKSACEVAHEQGALFHTDAVQALGKIPVNVVDLGVDYATFSAHKIHGVKGAGALYHSPGSPMSPLVFGGKQEYGFRSGTENTFSIVAFGAACVFAEAELNECVEGIAKLRDALQHGIVGSCSDVVVNGADVQRLPNTLSVCFQYLHGDGIVLALDRCGVCVSSGSACASSSSKMSRTIGAMGRSYCDLFGTIRFSLSYLTTQEQIDYVLGILPAVIHEQRQLSPFFSREKLPATPFISAQLEE